jgi:hypothetical protein
LRQSTAGRNGIDAIRAATEAHCRFCTEAPQHVRAFYILWFESIGPDSGVRDVVAGIHARRQRDVAQWIEAAQVAGHIDRRVDAEAIAAQFGAAIVGIVYQWLLGPAEMTRIRRLHDDLVETMQALLAPA